MKRPLPLYRTLAASLRADITSGKFKPGDSFPTEMEICEIHSVSRHTAREALRILTDDGLIERRRGAGTVVVGERVAAFAQSINDFDSLLQYARDAHFQVTERCDAGSEILDRYGLTGDFIILEGIRRELDKPPQASVSILVRRDLAPDLADGAILEGSISERIEQQHGIPIARVTQRMEAVALDPKSAARLDLDPGTPALSAIRRFRDGSDEVILLSISLYPAGRFAYEMQLERR
ncbi:GntR family transcriptional regulator [Parvularcula lutaonensis]|uniref:GntR family transcriptional regulator n=1 Tax=Parvularcula lutaonensis TaxID=491923 RepID=A0ABV7MCT2_9PROT|nr:GntR family transcriptional regulator [Parvularcula lutaonensis]GGY38651.1 GntR family transcriptional regulator [Parvularcula lutaonensis]